MDIYSSNEGAHSSEKSIEDGRILPVSALLRSARLVVERELPLTWIRGEISNYTRAASGHIYFVLKDAHAQVRCVLFRQKAQLLALPLADGLQIEVRASATIYEPRGEFQLNVDTTRLAGAGALYEAFARLKAKLEALGWFASENKKPLPFLARQVGIVTSPKAAALRDILTIVRTRCPSIGVVIYPTPVQGFSASGRIAAAIATANRRAECEVLLLCRGGGTIEDLWAFNEEVVAHAIHRSRIPIVTGIGHETDFTIADFVADLRAPTPSAAAACAVPIQAELLANTQNSFVKLGKCLIHALQVNAQRLDYLQRRLKHPADQLAEQALGLTRLQRRLEQAWSRVVERKYAPLLLLRRHLLSSLRRQPGRASSLAAMEERLWRALRMQIEGCVERVDALAQNLHHLNPFAVLQRGYSIVSKADGTIVDRSRLLSPGESVRLRFASGQSVARVEELDH